MPVQLERTTERGRQAFRDGVKKSACPYKDIRTRGGAVTWSRAYRKAWMEGWNAEDAIKAQGRLCFA
jgi:ribosome modulation factor